jgi:hypothetical protein
VKNSKTKNSWFNNLKKNIYINFKKMSDLDDVESNNKKMLVPTKPKRKEKNVFTYMDSTSRI